MADILEILRSLGDTVGGVAKPAVDRLNPEDLVRALVEYASRNRDEMFPLSEPESFLTDVPSGTAVQESEGYVAKSGVWPGVVSGNEPIRVPVGLWDAAEYWNNVAGKPVFEVADRGGEPTDVNFKQSVADPFGGGALGRGSGDPANGTGYVWVSNDPRWGDQRQAKSHELGHVLGFAHTPTGGSAGFSGSRDLDKRLLESAGYAGLDPTLFSPVGEKPPAGLPPRPDYRSGLVQALSEVLRGTPEFGKYMYPGVDSSRDDELTARRRFPGLTPEQVSRSLPPGEWEARMAGEVFPYEEPPDAPTLKDLASQLEASGGEVPVT